MSEHPCQSPMFVCYGYEHLISLHSHVIITPPLSPLSDYLLMHIVNHVTKLPFSVDLHHWVVYIHFRLPQGKYLRLLARVISDILYNCQSFTSCITSEKNYSFLFENQKKIYHQFSKNHEQLPEIVQ